MFMLIRSLFVHERQYPIAQHRSRLNDISASTVHCTTPVGARGALFQDRNRMGVSQTLHRISAMKNRCDEVCGLTYRIGRHIPGKETAANKHDRRPMHHIVVSGCLGVLNMCHCCLQIVPVPSVTLLHICQNLVQTDLTWDCRRRRLHHRHSSQSSVRYRQPAQRKFFAAHWSSWCRYAKLLTNLCGRYSDVGFQLSFCSASTCVQHCLYVFP